MLAASPSRTFGPLNNKEFLWDRTGFLRLQATETLSAGEQGATLGGAAMLLVRLLTPI